MEVEGCASKIPFVVVAMVGMFAVIVPVAPLKEVTPVFETVAPVFVFETPIPVPAVRAYVAAPVCVLKEVTPVVDVRNGEHVPAPEAESVVRAFPAEHVAPV